jgi:4-diphosphocytidyl-2-C-methyl-D-erythritol kinase
MALYAARAKINLRLIVLAREDSGYHQIETVFARLELADQLEISRDRPGIHLIVHNAELGPIEDNLVSRAAAAFFTAARLAPAADITLHKHIPDGAGLGGGSSDAGTTLLALNELHGGPLSGARLHELAFALGADVPFFVSDMRLALGRGRGEQLVALEPPPDADVLLVVPEARVVTRDAFATLAELRRTTAPRQPQLLSDDVRLASWSKLADIVHNDFEAVILPRIPAAARALRILHDSGASAAALTGSGSAVFGVYTDAAVASAAQRRLRAEIRDARVMATRTAFQRA